MLDAWLLAFCRFVPVVALHPLFGGRGVPRTVVVGVAAALAAVAAARCPLAPASGLAVLALSGVEELAVGATIALLGQCVFGAIEAAGRFVDDARGANVAHLLAPQIEAVASPLGQLELSAALAVFWGSGAYRPTVEGLLGSFDAVPFGAGSPPSLEAALAVADALARAAFALAGPAAASCVLVDVGMGLVNRASPNANAFLLAQPVKLAAAVIVTAAGAPARLGIWASLLRDHDAWLRRLAGS
jgi:type III secretory pathway component EscT